ncbi:hypothetical protein Leryth_021541 [Lithospermum erythrorhizon]|nr:hypothetical protein Leryth_021541 [Lithospermum erythrorhizon]
MEEFSRRRPRKNITSRIKSSDPKGFMPKPSTGLGTQKRDQKNNEEKEISETVLSKGMGEDDTSTHIMKNVEGSERASRVLENEIKSLNSRLPSEDKESGTSTESFGTAKGDFEEQWEVGNDVVQREQMGFIRSKEMKYENNESLETVIISDGAVEVPVMESIVDTEKVQFSNSDDLNHDHANDVSNHNFQSPDSVEERIVSHKEHDKEKIHAKMKLEAEANFHRNALETLAKKNLLEGNKVFSYPEGIKPDENIAIFLNRSLSSLKDEPDVLIMGAFNDWRWRSFTLKLNKTNLDGDWWYCQIHVPREAYNLDFVFFNGKEVYENNDRKDFCINVKGGMSVFEFEEFLLGEKHKELERLSKEQAEMERQAEEQRRIEAERAASEADRAEAREEVAKRRGMLQELPKKAKKSGENIWCIEPCEFGSADKVRLYYNRTTGPLIHSTNIWVHGGHNNWQDGLSIVERLVKSDKEGGDWWYSDVIVPDHALVLDWVFADGPPQDAMVYDNNNFQDFHAIVSQRISEDLYWVEEEHNLYKRLQEERRLREEAIRAKVSY